MKYLILAILATIISISPQISFAQDHSHHSQHNMILFGEQTIYASHIVYKEPHNYQVILKLDFDSTLQAEVQKELLLYPNDTFIFLLDQMDIGQIQSKPKISGKIFRKSSNEVRHPIAEKVEVDPQRYSIIFFNELPLDLGSSKILNLLTALTVDSPCQCKPAAVKCDEGGRGYFCHCSDGRKPYWECR